MNLKQKDKLYITDKKLIKLLAKPLIRDILSSLSEKPQTATEISDSVSFPKDKIYYHIKNLIANNILYICGVKKINNTDQKVFFPTAKNFITTHDEKTVKITTDSNVQKPPNTTIQVPYNSKTTNHTNHIIRKIIRRRRVERRIIFRRQHNMRRNTALNNFKGNDKRLLFERRSKNDQRLQIERREIFDRRINQENYIYPTKNKITEKKGKSKKNKSILFKNYLLKMRGINDAISFVYEGNSITMLHCKLSKIGFEIYSSKKYKFPFIDKNFTIQEFPDFIISIIDQLISKNEIKKTFISIHSEQHQYEMTFITEKNHKNNKVLKDIFEKFSLREREIISDVKNHKNGRSSFIYTKNKQLVIKDISKLKKFGINPRYNTSMPKIIYNLYTYYNLNEQNGLTLLSYIGNEKTHIVICQNNIILGSSEFPKGLNFFLKRLMRISTKTSIGDQVYFDAAHYLSFYGLRTESSDDILLDGFSNLKAQAVLFELFESYKNDLQKSIELIYTFDIHRQKEIIEKAYICGPGSHIKNLKTNIGKILKCGVESLSKINDEFLIKSKLKRSHFLNNLHKNKIYKKRDNSSESLQSIKNTIQKKKIAIEAIKSPESVKYKLARLEIEKSTKIKSIDIATKKLVQTAKDFKELKKEFSSKHKNLNSDLSLITKSLEEKGSFLLNSYKQQDQLKEKISEIEYDHDKNSKKNKKFNRGYKSQYQAKIKSATNERYKLTEEKEEFESKIDSLEQEIITKQDEIQGNNLKLDNGQSEFATFEYLKESIQRTSNAFKKSFIEKVRILEDITSSDLNSLNEASYLIVQNTKRINDIKESFSASINGEADQSQSIDEDKGDNIKRNLMKLLAMILEMPDAVIELKTFFSTVVKINDDQKELNEKIETIKNQIKKSNINQKEFKKSLQLITNELNSVEKDLKMKEDKRLEIKNLLIFVRENLQRLNDIDHLNQVMNELKKQIKLTKSEVKDLEEDITIAKDKVESKEDENSRIKIELERAQQRRNHDIISKEDDLKKLEIQNNDLLEKIEEQKYFVKQSKQEIPKLEKYCVQLEKSIIYKKKDLEDLNEEKIFISEKYSKEENVIVNQFKKQFKVIAYDKNQKIKESEKTKNITIKNFFEKEKATLEKKKNLIKTQLIQLDKDKNKAELEKKKVDKILFDKKKKLIPTISKQREVIKMFFRDLKRGRKIEEKLINLEIKKEEWDKLLMQEKDRYDSRIASLNESINRKNSAPYFAFVKQGVTRLNDIGDTDRVAKSMIEESIKLDLEEIKKEEISFSLFKSRYDIFMKKYRKNHRSISTKIKPFGGRQKVIRQKIKAAELKILKSEETIQTLTEELERKNKLFIQNKENLESYIDKAQEEIKRIDIQLIKIPEKQSRAEYDIDTKTALKIASFDKKLDILEKDYKSILKDLNLEFQSQKVIIETSKIEDDILKDFQEIEKTKKGIGDLKSNIKDLKQLNQKHERKLKREQKKLLDDKNLITAEEVRKNSIEDELNLKYDLNTKSLLKEQSDLINKINKYDDLKEQLNSKSFKVEELQTKSNILLKQIQKSIDKNSDSEFFKYSINKKLSKINLDHHMRFMLQIEKDLKRNLDHSENNIYKINSIIDRKKEDQTNIQRNINLTINDLSHFKSDQFKIEKIIDTNSKYLKNVKTKYHKTLDLILNIKESYPSSKLLINERISIIQTLIDSRLKDSETLDLEIEDLRSKLRKFKVDIALIDEELSKINSQMKIALEKSFYEDENKRETFEWGIENDKIQSYSNIAKLKSKSKEIFNDIVTLEEEIADLKHKKSSINNTVTEFEKLSQNKIQKMEELCTTLELKITKEKHEIIEVENNINDLKGLAFNYGDRIKKMERELKEFRIKEAEQELVLKDLDRSIESIKTKGDAMIKKDRSDHQNSIENDFTANFGLLMDPNMELNLIPDEAKQNESYYFTNKVMQNIIVILLLVFSISSFIKVQQIKPLESELPFKKAQLELINMRRDIKNTVEKDNELLQKYYTIVSEDKKASSEMIDILKYLSNKVPKTFNITGLSLDKLQPNYFYENNSKNKNTDIIITIEGFFDKGLRSSSLLVENFIDDLKGSEHFKKIQLSEPDLQKKNKTGFNMSMVY